jgi:selenocysteine-specific elongation factor
VIGACACIPRLQDALVIGSRLDADMNVASCRLSFYGRLVALLDPGDPAAMQRLQVYKVGFRV